MMNRKLKMKKYAPTRLLCRLGIHRWVGREHDYYCSRWGCGATR